MRLPASRRIPSVVLVLLFAIVAGGAARATDSSATITLTSNGQPVQPGQTVSGILQGSITATDAIGKHVQAYGNFLTLPFIESGHSPDTSPWTHTFTVDTRAFYDGENLISVHVHPHNETPGAPYATDFYVNTFKLITANNNPAPNGDRLLPTLNIAADQFVPQQDNQGGIPTWSLGGEATVDDDSGNGQVVEQARIPSSRVQVISHLGDSVLGRFRWPPSGSFPPFGQFQLVQRLLLRPFQQDHVFSARIVFFFCDAAGRANYAFRSFQMPTLSAADAQLMPMPVLNAKILNAAQGGTVIVPDAGAFPLQVQITVPPGGTAPTPVLTTWVGNMVVAQTDLDAALNLLPPGTTTFTVTVPIPGALVAGLGAARLPGEAPSAFALWTDFTPRNSALPCLPSGSHVHLNSVRVRSRAWPYGAPTVAFYDPAPSAALLGDSVTVHYDAYGSPAAAQISLQVDASAPVTSAVTGSYTFSGLVRGPHTVTATLLDGAGRPLAYASAQASVAFATVNDPPRARSDRYTATAGTVLGVAAAEGVLANDSDLEHDALSAVLVDPPRFGLLTLGADGAFTYTASANAEGIDSFTYRASDGIATSALTRVTIVIVNPHTPASVIGGWMTLGRDAAHLSALPGRIGARTPVKAWTTRVMYGQKAAATIARPAVVGTRLYGTASSYSNLPQLAFALDTATGAQAWQTVFDRGYTISPPTWVDGEVVMQWLDELEQGHTESLAEDSGARVWSTPFGVQWQYFEAAAYGGGRLFFNGGGYGGLYGLDAATGTQAFFNSKLPQLTGWAPGFAGNRLFSWMGSHLREYDPVGGAIIRDLPLPNANPPSNSGTFPVIGDTFAYVVSPGATGNARVLQAVRLSDFTVAWSVSDPGFGEVGAVGSGMVYVVSGTKVRSFAADTGVPGPSATITDGAPDGQLIACDDTLLVGSSSKTWFLDRSTMALRATLADGGTMVVADDALYLTGGLGTGVNGGITRYDLALPHLSVPARTLTVASGASAAIDLTVTGGSLTGYAVVGAPAHGALSGTAPLLTYTPANGYVGSDSFGYVGTSNGVDSDVAAVTVTVSGRSTGTGTGLTGIYFANQTLSGAPALIRTDATVDFDWGTGSPGGALPVDHFSARWTGQVQAQVSEPYTFTVTGDDGVRLWVDNVLVIDRWFDQAPTDWSGTIALTAGSTYSLTMEYYENGGGAVARLAWSSPSTPRAIVPRSQLYPGVPPANAPPVVDAGADVAVMLPAAAALRGSATDDGQPTPPASLSFAWSKVSGPGSVSFASATAATTMATFSLAGTYALRLTASDGALIGSDDVVVTVAPAAGTGGGTGLTGTYFANQTLTGAPALVRTDTTVDFDWGTGSPGGSVPVDHFSARWTGQVQAAASETYIFSVTGDDGVRLWVDNVLVIDRWIDQAPTESSGAIALTAGGRYDVKLEYYENGGGAVARLAWSSPSTPKSIIPQGQLYPATAVPVEYGWAATYYDNADFTGASLSRTDPVIDFDWGVGSPDAMIGPDTFSARWTGLLTPAVSEAYTFLVTGDDGVRLWVDNVLIIDKWLDQSPTTWTGTAQLTAGKSVAVKMEYYENGGGAVAVLEWASPSIPRAVIPQSAVTPSGGTGVAHLKPAADRALGDRDVMEAVGMGRFP